MSTIRNDENYINALADCSPNIVKFLNEINLGSDVIKWSRLDKDGCRQDDGTYFRVTCGLRSGGEQSKLYMQGRKGVKYDRELKLIPNEYIEYTPAVYAKLINRGEIVDKKKVVTFAWAGESYHNWGLAVDIVIRKFGDLNPVSLSDGSMSLGSYYNLIGLTKLASDCGLNWGGNFSEFDGGDVVHFEDRSYKIPPSEYWYNENMTFGFLKKLVKENKVTKNTPLSAGALALAGIGVIALLGDKKQ